MQLYISKVARIKKVRTFLWVSYIKVTDEDFKDVSYSEFSGKIKKSAIKFFLIKKHPPHRFVRQKGYISQFIAIQSAILF